MNTLGLVKNLVGFITLVALLASAMAVMTTQSLSVVERRKEIGLMKAVGARDRSVVLLFLGEGLVIAFIGAVLGFAVGIVVAQFIGHYVFDSSISVVWWVALAAFWISAGIVLLASLFPIKRALDVDPAIVLRGE